LPLLAQLLGFAWKTYQMEKGEIFKRNNHQSFLFVLQGKSVRDYIFKKFRFYNVLRLYESAKLAFSNSSCLKAPFCDGLMWTVGLTVEIRWRFLISSASSGRCLNKKQTKFEEQTF